MVTGILAVWVALTGLAWVVIRPRIALQPTRTPPVATTPDPAIRDLESRLDDITLAVSEGIARVDRAEKRIQKTVTSARRLVSEAGLEHAGIEAESEQLERGNGQGHRTLPTLPETVASGRQVRIPGGAVTLPEISRV